MTDDSPDTVGRLLADLTAAGCEAIVHGDVVTVQSVRPFAHVPLSLKWRASQLRAALVESAEFAAKADALILEASERIARERPAGFPVAGGIFDAADSLIAQAAADRDVVTFVRCLENREAIALRQMDAWRRLRDDEGEA